MSEVNNMALKKSGKKVSLNIKISEDLDARLKRARKEARAQGMMFNVSSEVEAFLLREIKKVEKSLSISQDINEELGQGDLFGESEKEDKKVEKDTSSNVDAPVFLEIKR